MAVKKPLDMTLLIECINNGYSAARLADKFDVSSSCIKNRVEEFPELREKLRANGMTAARGLQRTLKQRKSFPCFSLLYSKDEATR